MTIAELYQRKLKSDDFIDLIPRLPDLYRYGAMCKTVVEFGVRTGNSTAAFLAAGAEVYSYDKDRPSFECPDDAKGRWHFTQTTTDDLSCIPECDAIFFDTIHYQSQLAAELKHANRARKFLLFHDVIEWGWNGECAKKGINYAIWDFMMANTEWGVREYLVDQWGLLVLEPHP